MSKKCKNSMYNFFFEDEGRINVYNALTGLKCSIYDKSLISQIHRLKKEPLDEVSLDKRLIDTKIAVEEDINEVIVADDIIASLLSNNKNKLRLIILPTRECNFRCKYCYETKKHINMTKKMAENLVIATKKYLRDNKSITYLQLEWFGGEPLLCYDTIVFISAKLKEYCDTNDIIFNMSMTTNGYLLTKKRVEELLSFNLDSYQITVDGCAEYHDNLRVLKNGGPTWERIYNNLLSIKTIENSNLSITIRVNYHADMLEGLPEFFKMVKRDFDDRFVVYAIRINPTPKFEEEFIPVNTEAEAYALEYIIDLLKENNLSIERYMTNLTPTASACYARMNYALVVDTDGTLRKCTEFLDDEKWNNIGTVKNGIFEIDYYKHTQWLHPNPQHLIDQKCYECKDYPNCCGGLCPAQWLITKQVVCNPLRNFNKTFLEQYIHEKSNKK